MDGETFDAAQGFELMKTRGRRGPIATSMRAAVLVLAVIASACAAVGTADGEPPAADVFTEAEKQELGYDPDTEVYVEASSYESYATVDEMVVGSDLVVRGIVDRWDEGRIIGGGEVASESINIVLRVTDVLVGDVNGGEVVSFPWTAWNLNSDGTPGKMLVTNGIRVPAIGQELLLFLRELPTDQELARAVRPTHYLVTLDGLLNVADGRISSELVDRSEGESEPRVGIRLNQVSYRDLKTMVDAAKQ